MLTRRNAWLVALVATLTMTVSYVDRSALSVLSVKVMEDLHITKQQYGWLGSAFSMAYLFGTPLAGWWIDLIGARRGLLVSVFAWSVVAALHALVPGFGVLFALRLALGLAEGPGFPGAAQTVQRVLPAADRERGFGVLFTGSSVGTMLVPPFATLIFRHAGWRVALLVTTAAGLIWIPLWYAVTRPRAVRAQLEVATPAAADASRPSFFELAGHPIVLRALAAIFTAAPVFGYPITWGASYLNLTFKVAQGDVGHYLWLPPLTLDAAAILFGHLAARQRRPEGAPARGLVAVTVAMCATLALLPLAGSPWQSIFIMSVALGGAGAIYALVTSDMLARMPIASASFASGILAGSQSLALIIVNPLVGWAVDRLGSYDVPSVAIGLWAIPGGLVWLAWRPAVRFARRVRVAAAG